VPHHRIVVRYQYSNQETNSPRSKRAKRARGNAAMQEKPHFEFRWRPVSGNGSYLNRPQQPELLTELKGCGTPSQSREVCKGNVLKD